MIIHNVAQLSDAWWELRCGVPTASDFDKIITAKEGLPSKSQLKYAQQLAKDLQCHNPNYFSGAGRPTNVHVQRGRNLEEEAAAWYAMVHKVEIRRVGFVTTDDGRFGCSPDFFIYENGVLVGGGEVKCPAKDKHDAYVKKDKLPLEYKVQCHGGLAVCGLRYWAFIEYCPDSETPTLCKRVGPDDFTKALKGALEPFWALLQVEKQKLGLPIKEIEVTDDKIVEGWQAQLADNPSRELLNSWLPELSEIKDMPTKRKVWELIKAYATAQADWVFKADVKQFVVEELV